MIRTILIVASTLTLSAPAADAGRAKRKAKPVTKPSVAKSGVSRSRLPQIKLKAAKAKTPTISMAPGAKVADGLSAKAIGTAVAQGFQSYLQNSKHGGSSTVATWNRIDSKSVTVKSISISNRTSDRNGAKLRDGERMFTATLRMLQGKPGLQKSITVEISSIIQLKTALPRFSQRVQTAPVTFKAFNTKYRGDTTTVGHID